MGSCASKPKEVNADELPGEKPTRSKNTIIPRRVKGNPTIQNKTETGDKQTIKNEQKEEPLLVGSSDPKSDGNAPSDSTDKDKYTITKLVSETGTANPDVPQDLKKASDDHRTPPEIIHVQEKVGVENESADQAKSDDQAKESQTGDTAPNGEETKHGMQKFEMKGALNPDDTQDVNKASDDPTKPPEIIDVEKKAGVENESADQARSDDQAKASQTENTAPKGEETEHEMQKSEVKGASKADVLQDLTMASDDPTKPPEIIHAEKAGVENESADQARIGGQAKDSQTGDTAPKGEEIEHKAMKSEVKGALNPAVSKDLKKASDDPTKPPEIVHVEAEPGVENESADKARSGDQAGDSQNGDTAPKGEETEQRVKKSEVKGEGASLNSEALEKKEAETSSGSAR